MERLALKLSGVAVGLGLLWGGARLTLTSPLAGVLIWLAGVITIVWAPLSLGEHERHA